MVQFITGFRFIQGSDLYREQFYTRFRYIYGSGLYRVQIYKGSAVFSLRYGITYYKFGIAGW